MLKGHDRLLKYHRGHYLPINKIVSAEMFKFMEEENDSLTVQKSLVIQEGNY